MARYIPIIPAPYRESDARAWLQGAAESWEEGRELSLGSCWLDGDELLGVVSLRLRPGGSLGYWMRPGVRGHGVMTEALTAVVEWAETERGMEGLRLMAHPDNLASQSVARKAGFARIGLVEHEPAFRDGVDQPALLQRGHRPGRGGGRGPRPRGRGEDGDRLPADERGLGAAALLRARSQRRRHRYHPPPVRIDLPARPAAFALR